MTPSGGKIIAGAATVSVCTFLARAMAFVQKLIMASYFGTGKEADAFFLAFNSIVNAFYNVTKTSLAPFLPLFAEKRNTAGEAEAWKFAGKVGTLLLILLVILVAGGFAAAPLLVDAAENFPDNDVALLTVKLVRLSLPFAFFMGIASLAFLILNAYKVFVFPALGDVVSKILVVGTIVVFYRALGIYALAAGVVAGALACLLLQAGALRHKLRLFRFAIDWHDPALKKLGWLILPVLAGVILSQVRTIIDFRFASAMGKGSIAGLGYARGLIDTMVLLVPAALGVAIYPFFSDLAAKDEKIQLAATLMRSLRMLAFFFIPLAAGLVLLREPIIRLVFERGKFGADSVGMTSGPLTCFALGLPAFAFETIVVMFFFALKDTRTPVIVGVLTLVCHVSLILALRSALSHNSIALAYSLSKTLKVVALAVLLARLKKFDLHTRENLMALAKILACAALMAAVVFLARQWIGAHVRAPAASGKMQQTLYLGVALGAAVLAGVVSYAGCAIVLHLEEAKYFLARLKRKKVGIHAANRDSGNP